MRLSGLTMTGRTVATNPTGIIVDPNYSSVSLLLHGDGTNNSTTITDNSSSPKTPTLVGTPGIVISTAQKLFGTGSIAYTAGTGKMSYADNAGFNFGAGDFTIEVAGYFNNISTEQVFITKGWQTSGQPFAAFLLYMTSAGQIRFGASSNGSSWNIVSERVVGNMTANAWNRIAISRTGTSFTAYINGVLQTGFTFTNAGTLFGSASQLLYVGSRVSAGSTVNGYLDEIRLTKGVGRYTATYTPATEAFPNS